MFNRNLLNNSRLVILLANLFIINIFTPNILSTKNLPYFKSKRISYPGIKEDVYVPRFNPQAEILNDLDIDGEKINVLMRPPADEAHYHNPQSEILFDEIINYLASKPNVRLIIVPRSIAQKKLLYLKYKKYFELNLLYIPEIVVNGLNLIWHCDLVISGGGTMNREAVALGVPVYSIFRGEIGEVDKLLNKKGKLILIKDKKDYCKIELKKRSIRTMYSNLNSLALHTITKNIEQILAETREDSEARKQTTQKKWQFLKYGYSKSTTK